MCNNFPIKKDLFLFFIYLYELSFIIMKSAPNRYLPHRQSPHYHITALLHLLTAACEIHYCFYSNRVQVKGNPKQTKKRREKTSVALRYGI